MIYFISRHDFHKNYHGMVCLSLENTDSVTVTFRDQQLEGVRTATGRGPDSVLRSVKP
jgi:hypothetical protein